MENEIWKDIKGYEGLYQVSNMGRIKSSHNRKSFIKGRLIQKGYLQVALCSKNKREYKLIHRLVAEAFIENPSNLPQVNHKNEDKTLNIVENLEWCSNEYNHNYGTRNIRVGIANSKKIDQIDIITGQVIKTWNSSVECFNNGFHHVSDVVNGKRKQDKGYIFKHHTVEPPTIVD